MEAARPANSSTMSARDVTSSSPALMPIATWLSASGLHTHQADIISMLFKSIPGRS
jgi:hypothetical protein